MWDDIEPAGTVLLVGDSDTGERLAGQLSATGLSVTGTPDLVGALDRLDSRRYDCIVLAAVDGSSARTVERLRTAGHTTPVVVVGDEASPTPTELDALVPPDDVDAAVARIETLVDDHQLDRQRARRRHLRDATAAAGDAVHAAETPDSALAALCRELVVSGPYDVAWVGRLADDRGCEPTVAAGIPVEHLGAVSTATDTDTPTARAVATASVATEVDSRQATFAVPLGEPPTAVLHLVGAAPAGAVAGERRELAALGDRVTAVLEGDGATDAEAGLTVLGDALAHELGNQLDIAATHLELGRERDDSSFFDTVEGALERMSELADEARLLAAGTVDTEPVDLAAAAKSAWAHVDTADATLEADAVTVEADPDLLSLLLENLFRNAVEHGGPEVRVRLVATDDGFGVADDGPGIPPEDRDRVLEWGYSTGGTGVGLGIVALVAERHGWTVSVTGSQAGGALFEFS